MCSSEVEIYREIRKKYTLNGEELGGDGDKRYLHARDDQKEWLQSNNN
jgi:hypothetical protein